MTQDEFRAFARHCGLELADDELARMREGYEGLTRLLARLPEAPDLMDEPVTVCLPPGARITP